MHIDCAFRCKSMQFKCSTDRNNDYHYIDPASQPSNQSTGHLSQSHVQYLLFQHSANETKNLFSAYEIYFCLQSKCAFNCKNGKIAWKIAKPKNHPECAKTNALSRGMQQKIRHRINGWYEKKIQQPNTEFKNIA